MRQSQGTRANANGRFAERIIASTIQMRGYTVIRQHPIGLGIFGRMINADLYLPIVPGFPQGLAIESKWQESSGSVDEKVCYLIENIRMHRYPCPVIIIAGGKGARSGAIDWLRAQADGFNLYAVFSLEEFISWCNKTL